MSGLVLVEEGETEVNISPKINIFAQPLKKACTRKPLCNIKLNSGQ